MNNMVRDTLSVATVKILRILANGAKEKDMLLPVEMVSLIRGKTTEAFYSNIKVSEVLRYVASMMEE